MKILLTGGAGYIGSHTYVRLVESGHSPVIIDNFENSSPVVLDRLAELTGKRPLCHAVDVRDAEAIKDILSGDSYDAVIHFAGLKSVAESMSDPLRYYDVNVHGMIQLLQGMQQNACKKLILSSSATVYGEPRELPINEDHPLSPSNTYGQTKLVVEKLVQSQCDADPEWSAVLLRYFNPVGAHPSARIGEDPRGVPSNLMPFITQVATGRRDQLSIFGDDFDTRDGTGVRDYVHVCDLAGGHVQALKLLDQPRCTPVNLGTGRGYSVMEIVQAFERATGQSIDYRIAPRRPGDIAACYADPSTATKLMDWQARYGLEDMCLDAWNWQRHNPNGFQSQT